MNASSIVSRDAQRWCILATIILVDVVLWVNSTDSGIAKLPLFTLGATLAVALFLADSVLRKRLEFRYSAMEILVALHIPLFLCSALYGYDPVYTWGALALGVSSIVFFYAGAQLFESEEDLGLLFAVLEYLTMMLCIVGLLQLFFRDLPLNFNTGPGQRVTSLLGSSAYFSSWLAILFPLLLARTLHLRTRKRSSAVRWGGLAVVVMLLFAAQTRSAIIGFVVSMVVFLLLASRAHRARIGVLIAALALGGAVLYAVAVHSGSGEQWSRLLGEQRESLQRRTYFWGAGLDAFIASPLVGHGIGSFERAVFEYRSPRYWESGSEDVVPHAHNEILEIATEYGSIGLLLFVATLVYLVRRGITFWQKGHWAAAGIICSLIAVAVDNLANVSLRQAPVAAIVWLLLGILSSGGLAPGKKKIFAAALPLSRFAAFIPLVAWVVFAFGYGKYQSGVVCADVHLLKGMVGSGTSLPAASAEFQAAIAENPSNLIARSYLIREFLNEGRWQDAVQSADELQRLSPSYPKSSLMKALALLRLARPGEALDAINLELKKRSHPEAYRIQAAAYRALTDSAGERESLRSLLRMDLEWKISYEYRTSCERLFAICKTGEEQRKNILLLDSLEQMIGQDRIFFERLRRSPSEPGSEP